VDVAQHCLPLPAQALQRIPAVAHVPQKDFSSFCVGRLKAEGFARVDMALSAAGAHNDWAWPLFSVFLPLLLLSTIFSPLLRALFGPALCNIPAVPAHAGFAWAGLGMGWRACYARWACVHS